MRSLLLLLLLLPIGRALATGSVPRECIAGIMEAAGEEWERKHPNLYSWEEHYLRLHRTAEGYVHEMVVIETFDSPGDLVTRRLRRILRRGVPKALHDEAWRQLGTATQTEIEARVVEMFRERAKSRRWHRARVMPIVRWVNRKYEERREWSPRFRAKMRRIAKLYLDDSTYAWVESKQRRAIVGAMRFIQAPMGLREGRPVAAGTPLRRMYGSVDRFRRVLIDDPRWKPDTNFDETDASRDEEAEPGEPEEGEWPLPPDRLPEAESFDIDYLDSGVPDPEDASLRVMTHTEIGTFAVEDTLPAAERLPVAVELWLQLMKTAFRTENARLDYYGQMFHGYADQYSVRLYEPLGMSALRRYRRNGRELVVPDGSEPPRIEVSGTWWIPMVFHPVDVALLNLRATMGFTPHGRYVDIPTRRRQMAPLSAGNLGAAEREAISNLLDVIESGNHDEVLLAIDAVTTYFLYEMKAHRETLADPMSSRFERAKAELAMARCEQDSETLERRLPALVRHRNPLVRQHFATQAESFARLKRTRTLTPEFLLREVIAPLAIDRDLQPRLFGAHALRNYFLEHPLPTGVAAAARAGLRELGYDDALIDALAASLREALASRSRYYGNEIDTRPVYRAVEGFAVDLHQPLPSRDRDVILHLLVLAAERR